MKNIDRGDGSVCTLFRGDQNAVSKADAPNVKGDLKDKKGDMQGQKAGKCKDNKTGKYKDNKVRT